MFTTYRPNTRFLTRIIKNNINKASSLITLLVALICSTAIAQTPGTNSYKSIEWQELIPADDLEVLLNPPEYLDEIEDGSLEDQIGNQLSNQIQNQIANAMDDRYQQALASTNIKPEMNNRPVRIAGFIVPLEFNDDQVITEFFLVPFFGACIHVPPPPPNQIIYGKYPKGFKLENLYDPFWISGTLKTSLVENDMATAAYSIEVKSVEGYSEESAMEDLDEEQEESLEN